MPVGYFVALAIGIILDRVVIWDKDRSLRKERNYYQRRVQELNQELRAVSVENYAMSLDAKSESTSRRFTTPEFERQFVQHGRARMETSQKRNPA